MVGAIKGSTFEEGSKRNLHKFNQEMMVSLVNSEHIRSTKGQSPGDLYKVAVDKISTNSNSLQPLSIYVFDYYLSRY